MSYDFLSPDVALRDGGPAPLARSSIERVARAAGARIEVRDGWNVAVAFSDRAREAEACTHSVGWADVSHLGKIEVQADADDLTAIVARASGGAELTLSHATRALDAWWCPMTAERMLVVCAPGALGDLRERLEDAASAAPGPASVVDVTTVFGAMTIVGPLAREVFARFCALDLRPQSTPIQGLRPGSVARTPAVVIREAEDRFLVVFGSALGEYMWTVVSDAGTHLGGSPVGVDALGPVTAQSEEASHA